MKRDWNKIFNECMTELYANSEPKADFLSLINTAKLENRVDPHGKLIIDYEDYVIDSDKFDSIFSNIVKKYKIKKPYLTSFTFAIYLGASPKIKYHEANT